MASARLISTAAAAPSLGAHSISRLSGGHTARLPNTSSRVTALRYIAFGFSTAWCGS